MGLAEHGDEASADKLCTLLYRELHRLARRQLLRQGDVSIRATMLIHEACLDMATQEGPILSRSRSLHGLCSEGHAATDHRSCSQSAGNQTSWAV